MFKKLTVKEMLDNEKLRSVGADSKLKIKNKAILEQQEEQDEYLVDNDFRLSLIEMEVEIYDL